MTVNSDANLAKQLWAVGDPVRLRILRLLPREAECEQGNNVSMLAAELKLAQPTVSHHLRVLRQAGLVSYRKMCRDVYYWIDPAGAGTMIRTLNNVFATPPDAKAAKGTPRVERKRN
jgi:ArsR family transcriptional regulator